MKFVDLLVMSLKNLSRRKLRTALTVLGVVIGTASIEIGRASCRERVFGYG